MNNISKDPKAFKYEFNGKEEELYTLFTKKIKPMVGIVKYYMINWELFPQDIDEAKKLSSKWKKLFENDQKYKDFNITIYFHLLKKTIRFEIKTFENNYQLDKSESCYDKILENIKPENFTFYLDLSLQESFPTIEESQKLAREWSYKLHTDTDVNIYNNFSFIIFFNQNKKLVKVIFKEKQINS